MAFGVETTNGGSQTAGATTTCTVSVTVTAANLMLVGVAVGKGGSDPLSTMVGVTFNGDALSAVSGSDSDDNNFMGCRWYSLANPDVGTFNVVATFGTSTSFGMGIITFTDADTTLGTPGVNNGTTVDPTVTVNDSASGNIVVSALATDGSGVGTTANGTVFTNGDIENLDSDVDLNFQYETASGSPTVPSWDNDAVSERSWATSGLAVKAAGGGGGGASGRDLMLMGCGA